VEQQPALTKPVIIMAVAAGVTVANIYYNQPILSDIAATFHASASQIGSLPVLTQAGYGLGLLFLTPLGDMVDRKKLILILEVLLSVALMATTMVGSLSGLYVASFLIGILAVSVQIIMPLAAALATRETKGRIVGIVFTGSLTGILSSRILSGYLAEWLGWRWVYGISAGLILLLVPVLALSLPRVPSHHAGSYGELLQSTLHQLRRFALLRRVTLLGALVFGLFLPFWTTLTFHLGGPPFNYRSDVIGLFGLLAIAGTMATPMFGRLADKWNPARTQFLTIGVIVVSILCVQWLPDSIMAIIAGTLFLDVGVQATRLNNLAQIYRLDDTTLSRINTVYMTSVFIGGAIGTYAGVLCWSVGGWSLVCWQLLVWSLLALAVAIACYRDAARSFAATNRVVGKAAIESPIPVQNS